MLELITADGRVQLSYDDYKITRDYEGQDELAFSVSSLDPVCNLITEECQIYELSERQTYVVRYIQVGENSADIRAQLDLDDWRSTILWGYSNWLTDVGTTMTELVPAGWSVVNTAAAGTHMDHRVIELDAPTPLDVIKEIQDEWGCVMRFDTFSKTVTIYWPDDITDSGVRFTASSNLRSRPSYTGKSTDLCTRLYCRGKDGLTFADINGGKEYVENKKYSSKTICDVLVADSVEDAAVLLDVARQKIEVMGTPTREWDLDAVDLYRIDSTKWADRKVDLHSAVSCYDERMGAVISGRITGATIMPHYPEQNEFTITTGWAPDSTLRKRIGNLLNNRKSTKTGSTGSYGQDITYEWKNGIADIYYNKEVPDGYPLKLVQGQTYTYDITSQIPYMWRSFRIVGGFGYFMSSTGEMVAEAHPVIAGKQVIVNIVALKTGSFTGYIYAHARATK